ncbi:GGDEF domain-containing protein [Lacticaseibacillus hulanensis]|jgi:diguanylate cyclase (GGDEF)-like protein|uniref:GGDEF domain-containing protein n=1 Tax=Lacticaseibacillus hulanensis TaxID=2493111 RepID=UPI000FDAAF26|nr:GGDEF domain-containing protein [Lacticaseibacillus hulanensis]
MGINRIIFSFVLALITNGIVAVGATSFFYWINNSSGNPFIEKHRHWLSLLASFAYLGYLFLESINNTYFDQSMFGYHWTFLNMIILTMYFLNLQTSRVSQAILEAVLMVAYFVLYAERFTALGVAACIAFVLILFGVNRNAARVLRNHLLNYTALALFAVAGIMMVYQMAPATATDVWFWARQVGGFAIIGIIVLEYNYAMTSVVTHTSAIAERAAIDDLTGLLNYGSFSDALMADFDRYQADHSNTYTIFEFDLDYFKRVNDTYGHLAGNAVLRAVADELTIWTHEELEQPATAFSLGGEEFAVIVRGELDHGTARKVAMGFQRHLAHLRFPAIDDGIRLTCSVGEAHILASDYTHYDVYKAADRNLYQSKRDGRNLITLQFGDER